MKSRDFCYWLQGYFELDGTEEGLSKKQTECVKKHLALVFAHEIDPDAGGKSEQDKLNLIHGDPANLNPNLMMRC